MLNLGFEI